MKTEINSNSIENYRYMGLSLSNQLNTILKQKVFATSVIIGLLFLFNNTLNAQIVIVPNQQVNGLSNGLSDVFFFDQLFQVNLANSSNQLLEGFLELDIENRSQQSVIKITSKLVTIQAGSIKQSSEIIWGSNIELGRSQFISSITETGKIPYGEYIFCYRFISKDMTTVLGLNCQERSVKTFGIPALISPYDKQNINTTSPLLTWKPPLPLISNDLSYNIRLTYINENQSLSKAIRINYPLLERKNIQNTFLHYPVDAYPLEKNKRYVWQVSAMYNGIPLGETAIWEFIIQEEEMEKDKENSISYRFVKPKMGTGYYLADDMLFFAYDNRTNELQLNYEVYGENDFNNSIPNLPDISLNKGINKIDLAVEQLGDLELNTNYILKITDKIGAHYYFKFKYKG